MQRRTLLRSVGGLTATAAVAPTVAADDERRVGGEGETASSSAPPTSSMSSASVSLTGALEGVVGEDGTTVYVAADDGFGVVDVSDFDNPSVVAERRGLLADREFGPLKGIYDVSVSGDRLLVAGPRSGLYGQALGGFLLYDVSDPADPERVAFFETDHGIHNAFLDGETAYLTGTGLDREPLVVVDVAGDRPSELARWSVIDERPAWRSVQRYVRSCHDVYVQNDTAYVAYWDAGTWLLDVSDPANPTVEGHLGGRNPNEVARSDYDPFVEATELPGNSHYVAPNEDGSLLAVGREAWDSEGTDRTGGPGGITLWDASDRSSPERLTRLAPPTFGDLSEGINRTSHNFGFRGDRLYTSWYSGGVRVYDVSSPAEPMLLGAWAKPTETSFWTAQPADGGFVATSEFSPAKREELSDRELREPAESAKVFTFSEPSGENARPARTAPAPAGPTDGGATDGGTAETATSASDDGTTTETRTGIPGEADVPGFGVTATVVGGGLALARLLRKRS